MKLTGGKNQLNDRIKIKMAISPSKSNVDIMYYKST